MGRFSFTRVERNGVNYIQAAPNEVVKAVKLGHIAGSDTTHGYIIGDYKGESFEIGEDKYRLLYFDGCFYPYLFRVLQQQK